MQAIGHANGIYSLAFVHCCQLLIFNLESCQRICKFRLLGHQHLEQRAMCQLKFGTTRGEERKGEREG